MKKLAPIAIASLISAVVAILGYRYLEGPKQIVIRQTVPASYMTDEADLNQMSQAVNFNMPLTSMKADGFVKASYLGTKAVVAIQAVNTGSYWRSDSRGSSSGSGVVVSHDGFIATNNHVVADGGQINVTLNDQREFQAKVIGKDPTTDLALLKIDAKDLPYLQFGNSDSVFLGEWVLAVGNPFRLQSTVTAGIVSAKGRNIQILADAAGIESFIQTDAAVNPGNSGGALLNTRGELIGINTAIITYSGQYEGFSFAIPGNLAKKVLDDLRRYGSVQRGWLGVTIRPVDNEMAQELRLKNVAGVYLETVIENSAADNAGLKPGDVIVSVNNMEINTTPEFMEQVGRRRPGDKLQIHYMRSGSEKVANVVLSDQRFGAPTLTQNAPENILAELGMEARDLTITERSRLRAKGVLVERILKGSIIENTNMEEQYIITSVNDQPVESVEELIAEINRIEGTVLLDGFYERFPGKYPYSFKKE
ncbi:MAG TPA: trypsin-like peptidase domain-containing protein [Saprospiraceae bacterium]|nr:trypsin-like peptidase domain-containing protein [Saprospiraceae bacterium]